MLACLGKIRISQGGAGDGIFMLHRSDAFRGGDGLCSLVMVCAAKRNWFFTHTDSLPLPSSPPRLTASSTHWNPSTGSFATIATATEEPQKSMGSSRIWSHPASPPYAMVGFVSPSSSLFLWRVGQVLLTTTRQCPCSASEAASLAHVTSVTLHRCYDSQIRLGSH